MNQWAFVLAAYLLTLVALAGLIGWTLAACRRAEAKADGAGRRP